MNTRCFAHHSVVALLFASTLAVVFILGMATSFADDPLPPHLLELEAQISHPMVLINEPQEIFATIDIEALVAETDEQPPMNLALVIDRSGSMRGERINQARQAALHLVDSLNDKDRVALVTYGSDYTVEFDSTLATDNSREMMRKVISNIDVDGMTNLSAGFKSAVGIVAQHHDADTINRVILLSDGRANRGVTDPAQLQALSRKAFDDGISTSTIGFGLNYNSQLMTGMAVEGAGNYYFADDGHDLDALIAQEMTGLSATVANRIEAVIDPGPGVEIAEVYGFSQRYRDGKLIVGLSEMASGQSRSIVLRLSTVTHSTEDRNVLDVRINYRDAINDRHRYRRQVLSASVTESLAEVERNIELDVLSRAEEVRLARVMDEAMKEYSSGNQDAARALIDDERQRSEELRRQHGIENSRLDEMDQSMDRMGETVRSAAPGSAAGRQMEMEASEDSFDVMRSR